MLYPFNHQGQAGRPFVLPFMKSDFNFAGIANNGVRFFVVGSRMGEKRETRRYLYTFKLVRTGKGRFSAYNVKEFTFDGSFEKAYLWRDGVVPDDEDIKIGDIAVIPGKKLLIGLQEPVHPLNVVAVDLPALKKAEEGDALTLEPYVRFPGGYVKHGKEKIRYRLTSLTYVNWKDYLVIGGAAWCSAEKCREIGFFGNRIWQLKRRDDDPVLVCDHLDKGLKLPGIEVIRDRGGDRSVLLYGRSGKNLFRIVNDLPMLSWQ